MIDLRCGDCLEVLRTLPAGSVHCCVTSPPYWGLRDYGTARWEGGNEECDHVASKRPPVIGSSSTLGYPSDGGQRRIGDGNGYHEAYTSQFRDVCGKCGARRIDGQIGLEPTPEAFVARMVEVFAEVKRVLRDDGTCWINLGDSYATGSGGSNKPRERDLPDAPAGWAARNQPTIIRTAVGGLKPKDLVGIPWRVAFALQADGWYLRSDIIWHKPNPMPESVRDRPTKGHEYLFLLSKRERYYYDADAVREPIAISTAKDKREFYSNESGWSGNPNVHGEKGHPLPTNPAGRNLRTVWTITPKPYKGAHFATFPPKLVEPCVKAGTSERGVCPECGAPWERVVESESFSRWRERDDQEAKNGYGRKDCGGTVESIPPPRKTTLGWRPTCPHGHDPIPATVLDPFAGSGTTGAVALELGRDFIGIDLNPEYLKLAESRIAAVGA